MKRFALTTVPLLLAAAGVLTGCDTMSARERGTAQGAAVGAAAGAVLGGVTGGSAGRSAVIGGAVGAVAGNLWSKRQEERRERLAQASQGTGVEVARTADDRLQLNVPSDVSFDTGRADIKPQMRRVLDEVGRTIDREDRSVRLTIVGHTDSTGSDTINDPLSLERAEAVRRYLVTRGVDGSRIVVQGMGSRQPVASNTTEDGRARNRRVEIFLAETSA